MFSRPDRLHGATQRVIIVTGVSGAGKTTALKLLEDGGYECIDHVPLHLMRRLLSVGPHEEGVERPLAIGIDVRTRDFAVGSCIDFVQGLRADPATETALVFLDCDDEELCRRYTVTRHRHPFAVDVPLRDGIVSEREAMRPLRAIADLTIDTTRTSPGELQRILEGYFGQHEQRALSVHVASFSYRSGLPREADIVFDVRFLTNPYYQPHLTAMTGCDDAVAEFIRGDSGFDGFFASLTGLLEAVLPGYVKEGKSYLMLAIGCTGGRHRSVFVAEQLASWLRAGGYRVHVHHRELEAMRR